MLACWDQLLLAILTIFRQRNKPNEVCEMKVMVRARIDSIKLIQSEMFEERFSYNEEDVLELRKFDFI